MKDDQWHGWAVKGADGALVEGLHVGLVPTRKSVTLYKAEQGAITPLAYFRNEAAAREALRLLDRLVGR